MVGWELIIFLTTPTPPPQKNGPCKKFLKLVMVGLSRSFSKTWRSCSCSCSSSYSCSGSYSTFLVFQMPLLDETSTHSRWLFHSCTIFEAYLINYLGFSEENFSHLTPRVNLFVAKKKKFKIFGFKNVTERGIRRKFTFVKTLNGI